MVRGVCATEYKSLVAHKVLLDSDQLSFTVPSPGRQCACLVPRLEGGGLGLEFVSSDPVPPQGPWGNPMAGRCFKDLFLAGIVLTVLVVSRCVRVPAGWVRVPAGGGSGSGRRLGFVSGASRSRENLA